MRNIFHGVGANNKGAQPVIHTPSAELQAGIDASPNIALTPA
jgi:hypothetical protein